MLRFMRQCSRYPVCSVNKCPLDVNEAEMYVAQGDPEGTCKEHPRSRLAIAALAASEGVKLSGLHEGERERITAGETVDMILAEADSKLAAKREHMLKMRGLSE